MSAHCLTTDDLVMLGLVFGFVYFVSDIGFFLLRRLLGPTVRELVKWWKS